MVQVGQTDQNSMHDYQTLLQSKLEKARTQDLTTLPQSITMVLRLVCGAETYVCPLSRVLGVVPSHDLIPITQMPIWHKGILSWHGRPISVIDATLWARQKNLKAGLRVGESVVRQKKEAMLEQWQRIVLFHDYLGQILGVVTDQIAGPIQLDMPEGGGNDQLSSPLPYFLEQNLWWVECPKKGFE